MMFLASLHTSSDSRLVRLTQIVGHQHGNLLVHHLGNGVSEDFLSGFVDKKNDASFVDGDDGVGGRFSDNSEQLRWS